MTDLSHHIAIVTGSGAGIGAAIAERLAHDGAKVMMNDIEQQRLDDVKARLIDQGID